MGVSIINNLNNVKNICDKIGLTFYAVDASGEYQDQITDRIIAANIGGISFSPKIVVTKLIFEILYEKCKKFNASYISTGHYAKVVKNQKTKSYNVFVANDVVYDQSHELSQLSQEVLSKVLLPFSEMRRIEVEKIGNQILNLNFVPSDNASVDIFTHEKMPQFTQERAPESMIKEGAVLDIRTENIITDHEGVHHFHYGMKDLKTKNGIALEKNIAILDIIYGNGTIQAGELEDIKVKIIVLRECLFQGEIDTTTPIEVYIKLKGEEGLFKGTLFFNNNTFCHIELDSIYNGLIIRGQYITFYNKKGVSGRLIGGGEVLKAGEIINGSFEKLPKYDDYGDDIEVPVDVYRFKF